MLGPILQRFGVRSGERRRVARLLILHFAVIGSYTLSRATRDAVFLAEMPVERLPYLYVAVAAFTALISLGLERLSRNVLPHRSLIQMLLVSAASLVTFGVLLLFAHGAGMAIAFYLWTGAYGLILVSLYWALVNEVTDPRQARRLFGIIGAGGILGGMTGGALASSLGPAIGPEPLLFVAGTLLAGAAPFAVRLADSGGARPVITAGETRSVGAVLRDPYVQLVASLFLLGGITASFVDYQFKAALQQASGGDPHEIARFLGYYHTALNAGGILLQLLATGFLLRRLGASAISSLLPGGLVAGLTAALLLPANALLLAGLRLYEAGMRISLAKSAWEFLYFPLPTSSRRQAKTFIDAVVDRAAEALAGILILVLLAVGLGGGTRLLFVTLLFAVAWLAVSLRLKEAYVRQLSSSLRSLLVGDAAPAAGAEAQLLEQAHRLLDSPFEKRALYALELLERIDPEGLERRLGALQDHPAAGVRAAALARLADPTHPVASPVLGRLLHDSSAEVRTAAIQLYAARFEDAPAQLEKLLDSGDPAARAAALFHLLSQPGTASEADLATRLDGWLRDAPPATRAAIAQALGRRPASRTLHQRLLLLVDDPDPEVQREAIVACGSVGLREFVPALVAKLASGATRDTARTALSAFGNRIVGTLGDELADTSVALAIRRELPIVLAQIGTQEAANELLRVPEPGDATLALRLLKAQNKIRTRDLRVTFPRATVREALQVDVERYLQLHAYLDTWRGTPPSKARDLLVASLEERTQTMFARIFRRLGLLYPPHEILLGYRALSTADRRTRAQALEYLDSALLPEDRRLLVPLLEEPERRPILAEALYGIRPPTRDESLAALARGGDSWLQAGALYAIGVEGLTDLEAHLRAGLGAAVPLVRETASWSLARLEIA